LVAFHSSDRELAVAWFSVVRPMTWRRFSTMTNQQDLMALRGMVDSKKAAGKPFDCCSFFAGVCLFRWILHENAFINCANYIPIFGKICTFIEP
jgi:hypothetical protein